MLCLFISPFQSRTFGYQIYLNLPLPSLVHNSPRLSLSRLYPCYSQNTSQTTSAMGSTSGESSLHSSSSTLRRTGDMLPGVQVMTVCNGRESDRWIGGLTSLSTVHELKIKIELEEGTPAAYQRLFLGGSCLFALMRPNPYDM